MPSKSHFITLHYYFKMVSLTYTAVDFYEQASHIRGSQTNFTVSPRSSNRMISNKFSSVCFHLNRVGNGDDDISSEEHFGQIFEFYLVIQSL
jgi:hypothetical protein